MNNKNYQGLPMPEFDALPERIKDAWRAACVKVLVIVCNVYAESKEVLTACENQSKSKEIG